MSTKTPDAAPDAPGLGTPLGKKALTSALMIGMGALMLPMLGKHLERQLRKDRLAACHPVERAWRQGSAWVARRIARWFTVYADWMENPDADVHYDLEANEQNAPEGAGGV